MKAFPQGKITVTAAGTPVRLPALPGGACKIRIANIIGETGYIYLGSAGLDKATLASVIKQFWPTGGGGGVEVEIVIEPQYASNSINTEDYYIDASVSGESALVTYWQA